MGGRDGLQSGLRGGVDEVLPKLLAQFRLDDLVSLVVSVAPWPRREELSRDGMPRSNLALTGITPESTTVGI